MNWKRGWRMSFIEEYNQKKCGIEEVLASIRSDDQIFVGFYGGEPVGILSRIHEIAPQVKNVGIWKATDMFDYPVFMDPEMKGILLPNMGLRRCAAEPSGKER